MSSSTPFPFKLSRRRLLRHAGQALVATPFLGLAACGSDTGSGSTGTSSGGSSGSDTTTTTTETSSGTNSTDWLSGGTSAMEADFPPASDPYACQ